MHKMSKSAMTVLLLVAVCLVLFETALSIAPTPSPACVAWQKIAQNLSKPMRSYQVQCNNNHTDSNCAQLHCSGVYIMQLWFTGNGKDINVPFCFGLYMNHCDNPVSVDYTLQIPSYNVSMAQHITHGSSVKIPGLSFTYSGYGSADVYLFFNLTKNSDSSSINFSITAKVHVTVGFFNEWPSNLQKVLFPPTAIPVPPCSSTILTNAPTRAPPTCSTTQVPPATIPPSSGSYRKACELGLVSGCGPNEKCTEKGPGRNGVCLCLEKAHLNPVTGSCEMAPYINDLAASDQRKTTSAGFQAASDQRKTTSAGFQGPVGKVCTMGSFSDCGPNEICTANAAGMNSECQCQDEAHWNQGTKSCEINPYIISTAASHQGQTTSAGFQGYSVTPASQQGKTASAGFQGYSVTPASQQGKTASAGFQVTPLIIGLIVGGIVVIVVIIAVIIFLGRRRRQARYQNRQLLLSNDDDEEDDTNVNI